MTSQELLIANAALSGEVQRSQEALKIALALTAEDRYEAIWASPNSASPRAKAKRGNRRARHRWVEAFDMSARIRGLRFTLLTTNWLEYLMPSRAKLQTEQISVVNQVGKHHVVVKYVELGEARNAERDAVTEHRLGCGRLVQRTAPTLFCRSTGGCTSTRSDDRQWAKKNHP